MTILYPITFPTTPAFVTFDMGYRNASALSKSPFTGVQQVFQHQMQEWSPSFTLPLMKRATAAPWIAALASLGGTFGTFTLGDPEATTAQGIATGTPLVAGANQIGNVLVTDGWTISQTGILKAGDYIQIGSGSLQRLYMVVVDANSDGSGVATLDIWPKLKQSPINNASITVASCEGVFRLVSNQQSWSTDERGLYTISVAAMEAY